MLYNEHADLTLLDDKTVAIIGYGSQGHAHALNLRDSGVSVVVGLREDSSSVAEARAEGLEVMSVADAASKGDLVMVLLPDERHHDVYNAEIVDGLAPGNMLLFGHGFSVHYDEVTPPAEVDVVLNSHVDHHVVAGQLHPGDRSDRDAGDRDGVPRQ